MWFSPQKVLLGKSHPVFGWTGPCLLFIRRRPILLPRKLSPRLALNFEVTASGRGGVQGWPNIRVGSLMIRTSPPPAASLTAGSQGVYHPVPGWGSVPETRLPRPDPAMASQCIAGFAIQKKALFCCKEKGTSLATSNHVFYSQHTNGNRHQPVIIATCPPPPIATRLKAMDTKL